jgi:hypothetical protein
VLDEEMRRRLAELNPAGLARMANRLLEAFERNYWHPDEDTLAALQAGADELEDTLEGIAVPPNSRGTTMLDEKKCRPRRDARGRRSCRPGHRCPPDPEERRGRRRLAPGPSGRQR